MAWASKDTTWAYMDTTLGYKMRIQVLRCRYVKRSWVCLVKGTLGLGLRHSARL